MGRVPTVTLANKAGETRTVNRHDWRRDQSKWEAKGFTKVVSESNRTDMTDAQVQFAHDQSDVELARTANKDHEASNDPARAQEFHSQKGKNIVTDETPALIGSSVLPAQIQLINEQIVDQYDVVRQSFEESGLSADEWNALESDDREARLQETLDTVNDAIAAGAGPQPDGDEDETSDAETGEGEAAENAGAEADGEAQTDQASENTGGSDEQGQGGEDGGSEPPADPPAAEQPKRGRGRPPGSKNKAKEEAKPTE